ncbi:MAG TPA: hypothetical protein P5550_03905, partial [Bacteroidales bacterium]|nr:hypothetical protein [Bacteroidales bacterium]
DTFFTPALDTTTVYYVESLRGTGRNSLLTTFARGELWHGSMFNLSAKRSIVIDSLYINAWGSGTVEIYTRVGGYTGYELQCDAWRLHGSAEVTTSGAGASTLVAIDNLHITEGQVMGLYVTMNEASGLYMSPTTMAPDSFSDENLEVRCGAGVQYPFHWAEEGHVWNGVIFYHHGSGCTSVRVPDTVFVTTPVLEVNAGPDSFLCFGGSIPLSVSASGVAGPYNYSWSPSFGLSDPGIPNPIASPAATTTYILTVTSGSYSATDTLTIRVYPAPILEAGPDTSLCADALHFQPRGYYSHCGSGSAHWCGGYGNWTGDSYAIAPADHTGGGARLYYRDSITGLQDSLWLHFLHHPTYCPADARAYVSDAPIALSGALPAGGTYSGIGVVNGTFYPELSGPGLHTITYSILDSAGCTSSCEFAFDVKDWHIRLQGEVHYDNIQQSPMQDVGVVLTGLDGKGADTVFTGPNGAFEFDGIGTGEYLIAGYSDQAWAWGGVNATDALLIARHFVLLASLSPFRERAGDVNLSGGLNTTDALQVARRFAGTLPAFGLADWVMLGDTIYFPPADTTIFRSFAVLAAGDVNGSFVPALKHYPMGSLGTIGELAAPVSGKLSIPVWALDDIHPGALSLQLIIPSTIKLSNVVMNPLLGGQLSYHRAGDRLNIAWFSMESSQLPAGDEVLRLEVESQDLSAAVGIHLGEVMEFSDPGGRVQEGARLGMPLIRTDQTSALSSWTFPNPFSDQVIIRFSLPEAAEVSLVLYDIMGEKVTEQSLRALSAGDYQVLIKTENWASGAYTYLIRGTCSSGSQQVYGKLLLVR